MKVRASKGASLQMADQQLIAIAITVLAGTLFNNVRIGDMNNRFAKPTTESPTSRTYCARKYGPTAPKSTPASTPVNSIDRKPDELPRLGADHDTRIRA